MLFLETENDLLVSKTAMNLCILQFLPRHFFKEEILYRGDVPVFVAPSVSQMPEISDSRIFMEVSLGRFNAYTQISLLLKRNIDGVYKAPLFELPH